VGDGDTLMAKVKQTERAREPIHKRTSQGGRVCKTSTMNKHKKRTFKKYRGQGR
jgi:hypothetical protein